MALSRPHQLRSKQIAETLRYFDKYDYPLTWDEIKFWSPIPLPRSPSPNLGEGGGEVQKESNFYFLSGRSKIIKMRQQRAKFSQAKWQIANQVGERLKKFPTIAAIFVTGALAMNNCPADDDIDLMIVTYPNTLWITRFFLNLYLDLNSLRRHPRQAQAPNKICPNLWLDLDHLLIPNHNLYTAHEILQARVLWDRAGVHQQFLKQNNWVKKYLPVAYKSQKIFNSQFSILNFIFYPLNSILFALQYLYMKPKMTTERVGLGYAFFHPRG